MLFDILILTTREGARKMMDIHKKKMMASAASNFNVTLLLLLAN